jgi:hypothetical protein
MGNSLEDSNTTYAPVKRAAISGSSTNNTIVAAVTGKKIRVLQFCVVVTTAVTVKFQSSTSTDLTGAMPFAANGGVSPSYCPVGHFETVAGELLNMALGSGVQTSGWVLYQEV